MNKVAQDLREIDAVAGDLIKYFESRGIQVVIVSEYGIDYADKPVHLNRVFREKGLIHVREELGLEHLNYGMSPAFAVADHQIAHVYVQDRSRVDEVRKILESTEGVAEVLDEAGKKRYGLDHPRSGDFVVLAEQGAWFTYYYWLDDQKAPDFARTVAIHDKPGYDPAELFINPEIRNPKLKAGRVLLKKKLGFRYMMDVIGLDATLVKGSHGYERRRSEAAGLDYTTGIKADFGGRCRCVWAYFAAPWRRRTCRG